MRKKSIRSIAGVAALLVALSVSGCAAGSSTAEETGAPDEASETALETTKVRVATSVSNSFPFIVVQAGESLGTWEDTGLDVQVVEVPRTQLQELGVRWNAESDGGMFAGLAWDAGTRRWDERPGSAGEPSPMPIPGPAAAVAGYFGVNALLSARINAMAQTGRAVVLAQPQLLARSGATAEFLAGGEVPYSTTDANGNTNTAFKPYGVSLRITPQIERNGAVRSHIEVEVSSIDSALSVPTGPSLKTRRASTEFNVRSGQTLVMAGFLSRDESRNVSKVPGLGDVPILGRLFSSTRFQHSETELAIFVTPVVVAADHPDLQARVSKGRQILQSTFSAPEVLNVPIRALDTMPAALGGNSGWNPYAGPGSQWGPEANQE